MCLPFSIVSGESNSDPCACEASLFWHSGMHLCFQYCGNRQNRFLGPDPSLPKLIVSSKPMRDPDLKSKLDGPWTLQVIYPLGSTSAHVYLTHTYTFIDNTYIQNSKRNLKRESTNGCQGLNKKRQRPVKKKK